MRGTTIGFSKFERRYWFNFLQSTASGTTGSALVATNNVPVPVDLGLVVEFNPRYDPVLDIIRLQVNMKQVLQSGSQTATQYLNSGTGGTTPAQVEIPNTVTVYTSGEMLVRPGSLAIFGGQREETSDSVDAGTTGLKDTLVGPLFGQRTSSKRVGTYYFALEVNRITYPDKVAAQ